MKTTLHCLLSIFLILSTPALFLSSYFGWMCHHTIDNVFVLLNHIMDLKLLSYSTLVFAAPFSVRYTTRHQIFCSYLLVFVITLIWHHTNIQTHTWHIKTNLIDLETHIIIFWYHQLCANNNYIYYFKWITC